MKGGENIKNNPSQMPSEFQSPKQYQIAASGSGSRRKAKQMDKKENPQTFLSSVCFDIIYSEPDFISKFKK